MTLNFPSNPADGDTYPYTDPITNTTTVYTWSKDYKLWTASAQGNDLQSVCDNGSTTTTGATFGGDVDMAGVNTSTYQTGVRAETNTGNSTLTVYGDSTNDSGAFVVYDGQQSGDARSRASINNDGSAYFLGQASIGTNTQSNFGEGAKSLEIHSSASDNAFLTLTNQTTGEGGVTNGFNIIMSNNEARLFNRENGDMTFWTNGTERTRIDSTGDVQIGTNGSKDDTYKLQLQKLSNDGTQIVTGDYIRTGGTNRENNGTNKLIAFHHGYWGGDQEVASIDVITSSSSGGSGTGSGDLVFNTGTSGNGDSGSTSTERLRITSNGLVQLSNNSPGIQFGEIPSESPPGRTIHAMQLDAYEEGTWSPSFNSDGAVFSMDPSYSTGRYIRVGNLVNVWAYIGITAAPTGTTGNPLYVIGLPFKVLAESSSTPSFAVSSLTRIECPSNVIQMRAQGYGNSYAITLNWNLQDGEQVSLMPSNLTASSYLAFSGSYRI